MNKNILAFALALIFGVSAWAQNATPQHPRALEIEKIMQKELQGMLRDMMMDKPFHVSVKVTPLRRDSAKNAGKENLPYYETSEEIRDEWDDPAKTEFELMQRVSRIAVKLEVGQGTSASEISDLKSAISTTLSLVDSRDNVEVETKDFQQGPAPGAPSTFSIIAFAIFCVFAIGYGAISFISSRKLATAIKNVKVNPAEGGSSAPSAPMPQMNSFGGPGDNGRKERSSGFSSDSNIQFQDTLKMMEVVTGLLKTIQTSPAFPSLEDMTLFEKYAAEYPSSTGALFAEFPTPMRNKVFSLTYSTHWLNTLTEPGKIDSASFELISRLARIERSAKNPKWEELLICCWRLEDKLGSFLRRMDSKDSVAILKALPQSLSLRVARETMPGEWASVLKPNHEPAMPADKIEKYLKSLYAEHPLRSHEVLDQYKKDVELMNFLRTSDPQIEKEVYGALPATSSLFKLRPPFFQVLDASPEKLKEFVPKINIEDWALALMNVSKTQRSQVDSCFFDRQKFRFVELLKAYDRSGVSVEVVGQTREKIANLYQSFHPSSVPVQLSTVVDSIDDKAAA